jgi:hypothetical protein
MRHRPRCDRDARDLRASIAMLSMAVALCACGSGDAPAVPTSHPAPLPSDPPVAVGPVVEPAPVAAPQAIEPTAVVADPAVAPTPTADLVAPQAPTPSSGAAGPTENALRAYYGYTFTTPPGWEPAFVAAAGPDEVYLESFLSPPLPPDDLHASLSVVAWDAPQPSADPRHDRDEAHREFEALAPTASFSVRSIVDQEIDGHPALRAESRGMTPNGPVQLSNVTVYIPTGYLRMSCGGSAHNVRAWRRLCDGALSSLHVR